MIIEKDRVAIWIYRDKHNLPVLSTVDHGNERDAPDGSVYEFVSGPHFLGDDSFMRISCAPRSEQKNAADPS